MIDQVLNHTSCEHPWFRAALDGDDGMAERYLFRDPKPDGTQPNNWLSQFGPPGWTWAHKRRQYYFHQFLACQPSLNLRHPAVLDAHRDQIGFWRDRGVDGFRFDAVTSYLWDASLKDNPPASPEVQEKVTGPPFVPYTFQDHVHDMLPGDGATYAENLRDWAGPDMWLMGEITSGNRSVELAMEFSGAGRLNACYTTDLPENGGDPATVANMIARADLQRLVGWLVSHDQPRQNWGQGKALAQALLMAVLPGPWLIYQGEEWGLRQPDLAQEDVTDPLDLLYWPDGPGREGSRVPMPWTPDAPDYGFGNEAPWLPMGWDRDALRRAQQPGGIADIHRRAIALRREHGWNTARVVRCDHGKGWLDLEIEGSGGAFRAWFGTDEGRMPQLDRDAALIALPGDGAWGGVWPLAASDRQKGSDAA